MSLPALNQPLPVEICIKLDVSCSLSATTCNCYDEKFRIRVDNSWLTITLETKCLRNARKIVRDLQFLYETYRQKNTRDLVALE